MKALESFKNVLKDLNIQYKEYTLGNDFYDDNNGDRQVIYIKSTEWRNKGENMNKKLVSNVVKAMNKKAMDVKDLSRDQLIELKQHYYSENHDNVSYGELADIDNLVSDEEIFEEYANTDFSEDDFFSSKKSSKRRNTLHKKAEYLAEEDVLFKMFEDFELFTPEEIHLCQMGWGKTIETAETMLYVRTGLRSLEQLKDDLKNSGTDPELVDSYVVGDTER